MTAVGQASKRKAGNNLAVPTAPRHSDLNMHTAGYKLGGNSGTFIFISRGNGLIGILSFEIGAKYWNVSVIVVIAELLCGICRRLANCPFLL